MGPRIPALTKSPGGRSSAATCSGDVGFASTIRASSLMLRWVILGTGRFKKGRSGRPSSWRGPKWVDGTWRTRSGTERSRPHKSIATCSPSPNPTCFRIGVRCGAGCSALVSLEPEPRRIAAFLAFGSGCPRCHWSAKSAPFWAQRGDASGKELPSNRCFDPQQRLGQLMLTACPPRSASLSNRSPLGLRLHSKLAAPFSNWVATHTEALNTVLMIAQSVLAVQRIV